MTSSPASAVSIRPATHADVPALETVMLANDEPPEGAGPFAVGAQQPYLAHLVRRGAVAVALIEGALVGFGATVDSGRSTHLADLFVLPAHQGQGSAVACWRRSLARPGREPRSRPTTRGRCRSTSAQGCSHYGRIST